MRRDDTQRVVPNFKIGYHRLPLVTGNTLVFFREALAQSGAKHIGGGGVYQRGGVPPFLPLKDAKGPVPAGVKYDTLFQTSLF